jgi:U3 small nucleolar RNA-associated protein 12
VTDLNFVNLESGLLDALVTSSLDGLVKIWDLKAQCCIQTIASHRGKVWTSACLRSAAPAKGMMRARLVTGDDDGFAKVWSMDVPTRHRVAAQGSFSGRDAVTVVEDSTDDERAEFCRFMGYLLLPPGMPPSSEHVASARFHPSGKYVGVLHANSKSIHVFVMRSPHETQKRKQRRISRRRQKAAGSQNGKSSAATAKTKMRGMLDEDEEADPEAESGNASRLLADPEMIEAMDEFEYIGTVSASHKIRTFVFVPWNESGSTVRIVCSIATNALETLSLQRPRNRYVVDPFG